MSKAVDQRIAEVDATRGIAMLFVCISHFALAYFERNGAQQLAHWSFIISQVASPTFMMVSGMMLGLLYQRYINVYDFLRGALIGRGVYLLTVIHLILLLPHIVLEGSVVGGLRWMFITDTIGISMILGATLIDKMSMSARVMLSLLLYASSTLFSTFWNPEGYYTLAIKDALFGVDYSTGFFREFFAVVPWFSYYFASTVLGQSLARSGISRDSLRHFRDRIWVIAAVLLAVGGVIFFTRGVIRGFAGEDSRELVKGLTAVAMKRPPSPMYFAVHCGMGLALLAAFITWRHSNRITRLVSSLSALHGRVSLFVFVLHYYVYFGVIPALGIPMSPYWPLIFIASLALITAGAYYWDSRNLNRKYIIPSLDLTTPRELHLRAVRAR